MWLASLFRKASDLERQDAEIVALKGVIKGKNDKIALLEAAVDKQRTKLETALRRTADLLCRQQKLPERFVKDTEEKEPEPQFIHPDREKFEHYAREMRDNDIATMGIENVRPLEDYVERIEADPEQVFIG